MMVMGPVCPMPDRARDGRLRRDAEGRPVFGGLHDLRFYRDGTGAACAKCSRTWRVVSLGRDRTRLEPT